FIYCMMIVFQTFVGPYKPIPNHTAKEPVFGMLLPPIVLGILVIVIFIFPNYLADYMIIPAIVSVYPAISVETIAPIVHWHGFNKELWMTLGILLFGSFLYLYRTY